MSNSNRSLIKPSVRQTLFSTPIDDFIEDINLPRTRKSKSVTTPAIKDDEPMLDPDELNLIKSRMDVINKIAPDEKLITEDELKRLSRLEENKRQARRPILSTSVGSSGDDNIFGLDTRGASKAVDEFTDKKKRVDKDEEMVENASERGELEQKKKTSERNTELREDLIRDIPESIEDERERIDKENQRYHSAGLRLVSQGDIAKAEQYFEKAGLSPHEINQELSREQADPKPTKDGNKQEGQGLDGEIESPENQNLKSISEPEEAKTEDSLQNKQGQWKITPPSEEEINKAIDLSLTDQGMFAVREALGNSIVNAEDDQTRNELISRLNNVNQAMLLNNGVPEAEVERLSKGYTQAMIEDKLSKNQTDDGEPLEQMPGRNEEADEPSIKDLITFWPKVANSILKIFQHPIIGKKNLKSLGEIYHNTDLDNKASWKELMNRWKQNQQDYVQEMTNESVGEREEEVDQADQEKPSSTTPIDTAKLDSLESTINELEKEADSDQMDMINNIRLELQDMRSTGKI